MRTLILGVLLGAALLGAVRLFFAPLNPVTHHHANWLILIDGEPLDLSADRYMEEIGACTAGDETMRPEDRIHLHGNDGGLVHVHHPASTWGALAANLGFSLGEDFLYLDTGERFEAGGSGGDGVPGGAEPSGYRLVFIRNGFPLSSVHNLSVESGDRLLISWSDAPLEEIRDMQFPFVRSDAEVYNELLDPASCSGGHGDLPFLTRLRLAFWG